jgi:hypothetical protein
MADSDWTAPVLEELSIPGGTMGGDDGLDPDGPGGALS